MSSDLSGRSLGKYQIYNRLGAGGMGEVYRAFQSGMDRVVAIKVLGRMLHDDRFVQRFQREAKSAGSLRHPHIIQVFDFGIEDGIYYMAMEYIAGPTLQHHLEEHGALSLDETLRIGSQIADALDYAHTRGIIHRDIKPANVMFIDASARDVVLTDFGLARIKDDAALTGSGVFLGTPYYISPEAAQGHPLDGRTDLYSLGVMLYEMLTGALPFNAETPTAVIVKHIMSPVPSPRELRADLPQDIEQMVKRTLAKNPDERYANAGALKTALDDLRRALPDDLRTVTPAQRGYRPDLPTMAGGTSDVPLIIPPPKSPAATRPAETQSDQTLPLTPTSVTPSDSPIPPMPIAASTSPSIPTPPPAPAPPSGQSTTGHPLTTQPQPGRQRNPWRTGCILAIGIVLGISLMIALLILALQETPGVVEEIPTIVARDMTEAAQVDVTLTPTTGSFNMLAEAATAVSQAATEIASSAATNVSVAETALSEAAAAVAATTLAARTSVPTQTPEPITMPTETPTEAAAETVTETAAAVPTLAVTLSSMAGVATAQPGEVLVIFAADEDLLSEDAQHTLNTIRESFQDAAVRFELLTLPDINTNVIRSISARTGAELIIWTKRTAATNTINFTPSIEADDIDPFPDLLAHPFLYPYSFTFRVNPRFAAQTVAFSLRMTAGLARLRFNDWTAGIEHLEEARVLAGQLPRPANDNNALVNPYASLDYALGFAYFQAGDYVTAVEALDRALRGEQRLDAPYAEYVRYFRGLSDYFLGNAADAVERLNATNLDALPAHFVGYGNYFLGAAYLDLNNNEAALTALEAAREAIPEEPYVYYMRAIGFERLDDLPSAIAELTGALVFNPEFGDAYSLRGSFYEQQGLPALAIADYREYERITGQLEDWMQALIDSAENDE